MSYPKGTVYVVDDDAGICDALGELLRASHLKCRRFQHAEAFLAAYDPRELACLVLDFSMPGIDGLKLQQILIDRGITLPILFLTAYGDVEMAVQAIRNGAADFIEKPFDAADLVHRINLTLATEARTHDHHVLAWKAKQRLDRLTPREREVLDFIVAGQSNKEIARELGIGPRTVEIHRAHVMSKMSARSVVALVRSALAALQANPKGPVTATP